MKSKKLQGIVFGVIGVLLFSTKAVMVKLAYQYEVDVISLLMLRMAFALPFYVIMLLIGVFKRGESAVFKNIVRLDWLKLVILGTVGYFLASWFDFKGLERIDASLERLILFVYPTFVLILASFYFNKKIKGSQIVAIVGSYIGVFVMFSGELIDEKSTGTDWVGVLLIVASGLTYAIYLVGSQNMMQKIKPKDFTNIAMIISCVCVLFHYLFTSDLNLMGLDLEVYGIGFLMALFATVIPSYFISLSVNLIGASRLAIIGCLGPVSTISLAMLFLGETLSIAQIVGAIIIVATVVWINLEKKKG